MGRKKPVSRGTEERAGLYVRVSLDRSAHGKADEIISPETQEDRARSYCNSQAWAVTMVERDIDESAYRQHYTKRRGLMALLEAADRGEITKLVVWKFSRLSRRLREFLEICDRLEERGIGVVSITEQQDTSTNAGRLIRNILASFAEFQAGEISEQIFESWMTKARRGERPPGVAPYGTINNRGALTPDPETHHHLITMYQIMRDTQSLRAVWDYLEEHQVAPPRESTAKWNLNSITGILTNPAYVSQLHWTGETFQGKWDAIVPPDLWDAVQAVIDSRRTGPSKRHDARLLSGLIRCGGCGRVMWTSYVTRRRDGERELERTYACTSPYDHRRGCSHIPAVNAEELERITWSAFSDLLSAVDVDTLVAESTSGPAPAPSPVNAIIAEQERIKRKAAQLFDLLGDGSITREQFRTQNLQYVEELNRLEATLQERSAPTGPSFPSKSAILAAARTARAALSVDKQRQCMLSINTVIRVTASHTYLEMLGYRLNLKARRIGQTFQFGPQYQALDYQGPMLTDKQVRFILRAYPRCDKLRLAARVGKSYKALVHAYTRLRAKSPDSAS